MKCSHCGVEFPEEAKFCPSCGGEIGSEKEAKDLSLTNASNSTAEGRERGQAFKDKLKVFSKRKNVSNDQKPQTPLKKALSKVLRIIKIALIVFGLFVVYVFLDLHFEQKALYEEATTLMEAGDYAAAEDLFYEAGSYKDSYDLYLYCNNIQVYELAQGYLDQGAYEEAKAAFESISGFEDAYDLSVYCGHAATNVKAEALVESGDYAAAKKLYDTLPTTDFPDARQKAQYCFNKQTYVEADRLFTEGSFYEAHSLFEALGAFEDAPERMQSCIQTFPSTGETYHNPDYKSRSSSVVFVTPKDDNRTYIKIYTPEDHLVSSLAINVGEKGRVNLPAGKYVVKTAYGSGDWFGEKDLFGDEGIYYSMKDATEDGLFLVEKNYTYTVTLRISGDEEMDGDSLGSLPENRGDF